MRTLQSLFLHKTHLFNPPKPYLFSFISSFSSLSKTPNPVFVDYLAKTLNFSDREIATCTRCRVKSLENPQTVVRYLQNLGFSDKQIQSSVRKEPRILFCNVEKTLKPKIELFQDLGLSGDDLGKFVTKTSHLLGVSLEKKLVPSIEMLKGILLNDQNNADLIKLLNKCCWLASRNTLSPNVAFLKSCGIDGSELAFLLRKRPRLFCSKESVLRTLVSMATELGFSLNSRMFSRALVSVGCLSVENIERKFETFKSFGFSWDEYKAMIRKQPTLLNNSTEKSKLGMDFYLNKLKLKKEVLLRSPVYLLLSIEDRVLPRYRVLEIIKSKKLLKKEPSFTTVLKLTEERFVDRFISRFGDLAEELLVAYKSHNLECSSSEEKEIP